ncbi:ester cyclase [Ktedonosporobacter rubrisoli]|uniref:Ester cyclase n=1 Tax=Ktedonosporobacter rubrisoli TaxID=2509675 RepID=A0A4P6K583_KTERU|nr:ester cyclase [Ktedonosporobacter rubrisoli]QBD83142.1 ester cyclase [Ktedonosporobacter rubrisoli]
MSEQNIHVIQQLFEAFNTGDFTLAEAVIAPEYLNHEALDDEEERAQRRGPEELAASIKWLRDAFSDLHFEIQEVIAAGEKVVVRALMTGKHTGPFMQVAPTGKNISSEQVHLFRLIDGKVAEHRARRDDLGMLLQIGAVSFHGSQGAASSSYAR